MKAEGEGESRIHETLCKHTIGEMLQYFDVGTERQKMVPPMRPHPKLLIPLRNLNRKSLSLKAKDAGMGDGNINLRVRENNITRKIKRGG